ncbi:MAG: hypothetical protein IIC86_05925 [Chloroflexi bacterium]|nr:hypothetical protein [Chloroflexota bacterium]
MEELLRQILEELQNQDSTPWWLEVLRIIGPLVGGALVAAIGFFAVHQQNVTQRENMKLTTEAEADQQRRERLTKWREARYGELMAAFGEFYSALGRMNLVLATTTNQDTKKAAIKFFVEVLDSGRILQAATQVADKEVAELAEYLAVQYQAASKQLIKEGAKITGLSELGGLQAAYLAIRKEVDESADSRYQLNRRIEQLISEGD